MWKVPSIYDYAQAIKTQFAAWYSRDLAQIGAGNLSRHALLIRIRKGYPRYEISAEIRAHLFKCV